MYLTLDERERAAYISGDVERAALLAETEDYESDDLASAREEVDTLEAHVRVLERENDELRDELAEKS